MKLKFFLLLFCFTFTVFSQYTHLNLSLFDGSEFKVDIDNTVSTSYGNYAEFRDLSSGEHQLVVTKNNPPQVIYDGKIKIPVNTCTYAVIDEYGAFVVYRKLTSTGGNCLSDATLPDWKKCGPADGQISIDKNDTPKDNTKDPQQTDVNCSKKMKKDNFNKLLRSIGNLNFENSNVNVVKENIDTTTLSYEQVKEILSYFKNDDNKLEIAKYAYNKTCDKANYVNLYDAFKYDETLAEFKNFLNSKK